MISVLWSCCPLTQIFKLQTISLIQECKLHRFDINLPTTATLTREDALKYYKDMTIIRRMETSSNAMYKAKEIRGFLHLYSGQVLYSCDFIWKFLVLLSRNVYT